MNFQTSIFLCFSALLSIAASAQCGTSGGEIEIGSEAEIAQLNGCDSIFGSLTINAPQILSLEGMSEIVYIEEDFTVNGNLSLFNLEGCNNLGFVGGNLSITSNFTMLNLSGVDVLDSIGGNLYLEANLGLDDLTGLETLSWLGGSLLFQETGIERLDGLENLQKIEGDLLMDDELFDLEEITGLQRLKEVEGSLRIEQSELTSLAGLDSLQTVGNAFELSGNVILSNVNELGQLTSVGSLLLMDNGSLIQIDSLQNLSSVPGDVFITENFALNACCGIAQLLPPEEHVGGVFVLANNGASCNEVAQIQEDCAEHVAEWEIEEWLNPTWQNISQQDLQVSYYDVVGRQLWQQMLTPGSRLEFSTPRVCFIVVTLKDEVRVWNAPRQ